jgi:hypothetical protein
VDREVSSDEGPARLNASMCRRIPWSGFSALAGKAALIGAEVSPHTCLVVADT